jgi:hypothetical protein
VTRAPTEFRYWQNLERPSVRRLRAVARRVLGFDLAPDDSVVRDFAEMYFDADPLAEAFVDEVYFGRSAAEGRALLERAIREGTRAMPDAPESLSRLFADIEEEPDWVDPDLVELGARVFRRYGTSVFRFGGSITLAGYSESSVAKPLALSGGYVGAAARHRFLETAAFWIAVSEPGGLAPGAPGRASALRVRVMHVVVRRRLAAHPEWNESAWGVPISQADALLTLMGGSFAPGVAMQAMGFRPSLREIEAMMHFWRYVGHLMGVRPRIYPTSLRQAAQLSFVAFVKSAHRAGEDEKRLCQAYVDMFAPDEAGTLGERLRGALSHGIHLGYARFFLPSKTYRRNRLPPAGLWAFYPLFLFPFIFGAETVRRTFPAFDAVSDRLARASRDRWLSRHLGGRRAEYRPAEQLTR